MGRRRDGSGGGGKRMIGLEAEKRWCVESIFRLGWGLTVVSLHCLFSGWELGWR